MDIRQSIATVIISIIGSGALWGFIEYLLERRDKRNDRLKQILITIQNLNDKVDEKDAITTRVRILRFMDQLQGDRKHTKDAFDQVFSDITSYKKYCGEHPNFKNDQTAATIEFISKVYQERLEKHDFL